MLRFDSEKRVSFENADGASGNRSRDTHLKLLTFNLGLFGIALPAARRFPLDRHVARRLAAAPASLIACDADILVLQEVYAAADRAFLHRALAPDYRYSVGSPRSASLIGNGLMVFSRHPLVDLGFFMCRGHDWTHLLWRQGFLLVEIDMPGVGPMRLMNVHLSASTSLEHPESPGSAANRDREISALLDIAGANHIDVIAGDFNTSPAISPANYRRFEAAGFADAYTACNGRDREMQGVTWDAANSLNAAGWFRASPSQRIDHVFVRSDTVAAATARVVLKERCVLTRSGAVCLSDHYGMLVALNAATVAKPA